MSPEMIRKELQVLNAAAKEFDRFGKTAADTKEQLAMYLVARGIRNLSSFVEAALNARQHRAIMEQRAATV